MTIDTMNTHSVRDRDLSNNQFSGEIPEQLGSLVGLKFLYGKRNSQRFSNLTDLELGDYVRISFGDLFHPPYSR